MKPAPLIHCIGDSHVSLFSGYDKIQAAWPDSQDRFSFFRNHRIGAVLAYNLIKPDSTSRGRERLFEKLDNAIPPESHVMLCFGEIDCRAHLLRQVERQQRPIESIVNDCLDRYFQVGLEVARRGHRLMFYNAPPSSRKRNKMKEFPTVGTCRERNHVTRLFNEGLKARADSEGFLFLANFDDLVTRSGLSPRSIFFDKIHLAQRAMVPTLRNLAKLFPDTDFPEPAGWRRQVLLSHLGFKVL
jgi:hypothetical protein